MRSARPRLQSLSPDYSHGTRRQQQADVIIESKLFNHLYYFEYPKNVEMSIEDYCDGWRSVKNQFWDPKTKNGIRDLNRIIKDIKLEFEYDNQLNLVYITKVWVAQKQD